MSGDQSAPVPAPMPGDLEQEKLLLERDKLALERERLELEQRRFAADRRRRLSPWLAALAAVITVVTGFLTYLGTEDARQRERFEALVQDLTSRDDKVDPARRVAAATALPTYYSMSSWRRPSDRPFRYEVINLIAVSLKLRDPEAAWAGAVDVDAKRRKERIPGSVKDVPKESRTDYTFYQTLGEAIKAIGSSAPDAFRGANMGAGCLSYMELSGARLGGANLSWANLTCAILWDADLCDAILWHADLRQADLANADLTRADLREGDLADADLTAAELTSADLTGAHNLNEATFSVRTVLPDGTKWKPGTDLSRFIRPTADVKSSARPSPARRVAPRNPATRP